MSGRDTSAGKYNDVDVYGKLCKVVTMKTGKTVWKAKGLFGQKPFTGSGGTEFSALADWRRQAERSDD